MASGAYEEALAAAAPEAELHAVASAELAPLIQLGGEVDERVIQCVEGACRPLKQAGVDTVILGCTHYPLVRPVLQRELGRGVTVVSSGEAIAAEVERELRSAGLERDEGRRGRVPLPRHRRPRGVPPPRHPFPPAPDRRGPPRRYRRPPGGEAGGMRADGRENAGDLREIKIEPGFVSTATGSALIAAGGTRVICTASVDEEVPRWMQGKGRGWATAEYGMLPASTGDRKRRDVSKGRPDGRTVEIQRLIGRSLRGVIDFEALGERTVWIDCDVLEADGGTRCAAITGGFVALELALRRLVGEGKLDRVPLNQSVAAVSCGIVGGQALLDLDYSEDSTAEVDANIVMTGDGGLVEVQATAERTPLSRASLDELLALGRGRNRSAACRPAAGRRSGGRFRRLRAPRCDSFSQPETPTSCGSWRRLWSRTSSTRFPRTWSCRRRPPPPSPATPSARPEPPRWQPRFRRWPMTPASRPRRSVARPACSRLVSPARTQQTRRTSPSSCARSSQAATCAWPTCARWPTSSRAARRSWPRAAARESSRTRPGAAGGFGYDPAFVPADLDDGRTMAELGPHEKDAISHRGRAARALKEKLEGRGEGPPRLRGLFERAPRSTGAGQP